MITDERLTAFINSLDAGNPAYLNELEKEARETNVPIIRTETQSLLRTLIAVNRPERILEVGTAVGFSALCMSEYAPEGCQITTIEKYEKRIPVALENFRRFGKSGCIELLAEDAADALKKLKGSYDFIFMDAAKGQYMNFLPDVLRLLRTGGLMVSDNVLQDGDILESRYAVARRDRTIHARMREYLYELKHNPLLVTSVLPVGDGVAVSVKVSPGEDGTGKQLNQEEKGKQVRNEGQ